MSQSSQLNRPQFNEVQFNYGAVSAIDGKSHLKLAGIGFLVARDANTGRHSYGRDQAPTFVGKFGSGDPTYRDSSFFPHWVQINWRNGSKQDEWDDEGRFLTSKNVDITKETELSLSKLLSALQLSVGSVDITCWEIDYSDSRKIFAGTSNGHVWRGSTVDGTWSDLGDITTTGSVTGGRRINCLIFSKIGLNGARATGSGQMYAGVGTPGGAGSGGVGTAEIYRYDGSWASCARYLNYDSVTSMCEFNNEMYAAFGGSAMIKRSSAVNFTSITPPGAPTIGSIAASGSVDTGAHYYKITLVNTFGETSLGTTSAVATTTAGNNTVNLTAIPVGAAASGVTARKVYRTKLGDTSKYYLVGTISDNTTTTYADTKADSALATTDSAGIDNSTAWATTKDIDYPGYIWDMTVYNQRLYAAGGHPESSPTVHQLGTLWSFDGYLWGEVSPFWGTVLKSICVYDNLLFIGTTDGKLYVYNRANIDLLYEMPTGNAIYKMVVFDDKLHMAVSYRDSVTNGEDAVYVFDRAGTHKAYQVAGVTPLSLLVYGDELLIGSKASGLSHKIDKTKYIATGELQSSYFNANLPNIDKVWFDVSVETKSLPTNASITMYYKTDESDSSWTLVDSTTQSGSKLAKFAFPEGTYSKKLSYKLVLATTTNTTSPTIRKILIRYILQPDFKYYWKFKVACPDNLIWVNGSEPTSPLTASTAGGETSISLLDASGFPDPGGEKMYCVIEELDTGDTNEIYYTGVTNNNLIGCGSVSAHDITTGNWQVSIKGRHFHKKIIELKQRKAILDFVDIDSSVYRVTMYDYKEDGFVINQAEGLENEVSVSLLQA